MTIDDLKKKIEKIRVEISKAKTQRDRNRLNKDLKNFSEHLRELELEQYLYERNNK